MSGSRNNQYGAMAEIGGIVIVAAQLGGVLLVALTAILWVAVPNFPDIWISYVALPSLAVVTAGLLGGCARVATRAYLRHS